jgi:uncharacterized protein
MSEKKVREDEDRHRYVISVDGEDAGSAYYSVRDGVVVFTHTEVDDKWEGQGVGSALVQGALDDVVGSGRSFAPHCPFVAAWVERHPDYAGSAVD